MNTNLLISILLLFVESSLALTCKRCKDISDPKCAEINDEICPASIKPDENPKQPACLTHVYKDANNQEYIEKKCVIQDRKKKYECISLPKTKTEKCETCLDDGCNHTKDSEKGSASLSYSSGVLLAAMLALLFG